MAIAQTTGSNPLRDLANSLLNKAIDVLPGVLGVNQKPATGTNLPPSETKGATATKVADVPWYRRPSVWLGIAAGAGIAWILMRRP